MAEAIRTREKSTGNLGYSASSRGLPSSVMELGCGGSFSVEVTTDLDGTRVVSVGRSRSEIPPRAMELAGSIQGVAAHVHGLFKVLSSLHLAGARPGSTVLLVGPLAAALRPYAEAIAASKDLQLLEAALSAPSAWTRGVLEQTDGMGVDVVLECGSESPVSEGVDSDAVSEIRARRLHQWMVISAPFGSMVLSSPADLSPATVEIAYAKAVSLRFTDVGLWTRCPYRAGTSQAILDEVLSILSSQTFPLPLFPPQDISSSPLDSSVSTAFRDLLLSM